MPGAPAAPNYKDLGKRYAEQYGVDWAIGERQIQQESSWNPGAVSKAGARGIAQFMPATAARLGVNPDDPVSSLQGWAKYMGQLVKKYNGSYPRALVAYNAGESFANSWDGKASSLTGGYAETKQYLTAILGPQWESGQTDGGSGGSSAGWWDPLGIGQGIVSGITDGVKTWWSSFFEQSADTLIGMEAAPVMAFAGVNLIALGVLGLAIQSPPGQAALGIASAVGPTPVKVAAMGTQAVASGQVTAPKVSRLRRAARGKARP